MTEIWFYHLQSQPLAKVLPALVEKTLARGWKAVIQTASEERLTALDDLLWTYSDATFLPHGKQGDSDAERQPVYLTQAGDTPNGAEVRFYVDGTGPDANESVANHVRGIVIFDGNDPDALATARLRWKALHGGGATLAYWQQTPQGQWEKKAST